jgi:hypothetical protein
MTPKEKTALALLRQVEPTTLWGISIHAALQNFTMATFTELINNLRSQWADNPDVMRKILGFDLPSIFGMKKFSVDSINSELQGGLMGFRAEEEVTVTETALWVAEAGSFIYPKVNGFIYVDSELRRYVRLGNGQLFKCTNTDLTSQTEHQKKVLRAYFTGLID